MLGEGITPQGISMDTPLIAVRESANRRNARRAGGFRVVEA
jgi:hypothetical protein